MQSLIAKYFDDLRARYRTSPVPAFLAWWGNELAAMIPKGFKQRLMPPKPEVWIVPAASGGGDLRLWRMNEEHVLALQISLPAAVESNLAETLGYQLDQLTPFRAEQALFAFRVADRDLEHGRIDVDLRVLPKSAWLPLQERLKAIGIEPHALDVADGQAATPANQGFNLLPEGQRPVYVHERARLNWALGAGVLVMLALVMTQTLYLHGRSVERLEQAANQLRSDAMAVAELRRQLDDALMAANFLADRRARQPLAIEVLAEVSAILPQNIWLQQFRLQGAELSIQGLAEGAERVIGLVNDSGLLADAELQGQVTIDPVSGRERFRASARVLTAVEGSDEAAAGG